MPIKGLTEKRQFTIGGALRLGKKDASKGYPEASDHFIADFDNDTVAKQFHDHYGSEPKSVRIAFASNDPAGVFDQYYMAYGSGSGLKCKGDGETAMRRMDNGDLDDCDCPSPKHCSFGTANGCKPVATLQYFIDGIDGLHIYRTRTSGYNSIIALNSDINLLQTLRGGKGIAGVWLELLLVPKTIQHEGKQRTIYALHLHIPGSPRTVAKLSSIFDDVATALPEPITPASTLPEPEDVAAPEAVEAPTEENIVIPARSCMEKELGAFCEGHGMDKKETARNINIKYQKAKWADLTDREIYDAITELGVCFDDIPF